MSNYDVVKQYMETKGSARLNRHELFTNDGNAGLWTTDSGEPIIIKGKENLAKHAIWSLQCFPDWEWFDVVIHQTLDENIFWVECKGKGKIIFEGYPEGYYQNDFIHYFQFENGKIKLQKEYMNPCLQLKSLSLNVPQIVRKGL
ncbi:phenazine biosynthesis protein [Gilliamella sp. Fer1-1]|uniref:PhzA/PhzB family protein n=1 Tax=Gilliamella sp. Fer1-1 TaxID=3120240 RepID=UPI00080DC1F5|nr:PhzA/PhzB family protein [Gilliamella apicola]OCG41188.1 phenazine biosynthesis protein [Gilliamella apicola]